MKNICLFVVAFLAGLGVRGQKSKWHDLEGYFQSPNNTEMVAHFTARDSMLVAKLLWNNGELHLMPDSGMAFFSKEQEDGGAVRIRFMRDASGAVNQVRVMDREVWNRVANYRPLVKNEILHTPEQLKAFTGLYRLKEDTSQYLELAVENNSLTIHQRWDDGALKGWVPESELLFFWRDRPGMTLSFSRNAAGQVVQFVAFGRDTWVRPGEGNIDRSRFKSYEGKFRLKEDPDNEVRLIATDTGMVVKQLWDGKEMRFEPVTNTYFYNAPLRMELHIVPDGDTHQVKGILLMRNYFDKVGP